MPPRYRILLAKRVATDLQSIFDHIATDSERSAAKMVDRLLDAIASLDTFPHRAQVEGPGSTAKKPIRSLAVAPYIIFFWVDEDRSAVRILSVRHVARRRPKRYQRIRDPSC